MSRSKWISLIWIAAVIALVANTVVSSYNIISLNNRESLVRHTRDVQTQLLEIFSLLKDAESGQRGFVITSDKMYLEPVNIAKSQLPDMQEKLRLLVVDNKSQSNRFVTLKNLIKNRIEILDKAIQLTTQNERKAMELIQTGIGFKVMNQIRDLIHDMDHAEDDLLRERTNDAKNMLRTTLITNVIGTSIGLIVIGLAYQFVSQELNRRKTAEAEVRQINDRLEATVQTRTKALTQTSKELMRSNQELEKFAYVASHDLQEPLRKIQAFGDRLKQKASDQLDENCRDYVNRMQTSATRMRTLINDLLSYSRITSQGKQFALMDLNDLIAEVISDIETRLEECQGKVEVQSLPQIHGDPTQIRQLFQNLIVNALKFRKSDTPPVVVIRATPASDLSVISVPPAPTTGWRITISDNGIGFDPAYAERIFELFQRLHGRGEYDGTGIGLAVCRKIVERHGGRISANAQPNVGAVFTIDLPDLIIPAGESAS